MIYRTRIQARRVANVPWPNPIEEALTTAWQTWIPICHGNTCHSSDGCSVTEMFDISHRRYLQLRIHVYTQGLPCVAGEGSPERAPFINHPSRYPHQKAVGAPAQARAKSARKHCGNASGGFIGRRANHRMEVVSHCRRPIHPRLGRPSSGRGQACAGST